MLPMQHASDLYRNVRLSVGRFWAVGFGIVLAAGAMVIGTKPGLERLWEQWNYSYDHAFLIVGMSLWLAIRSIRSAGIETLTPSLRGGGALVLSLLLYSAFELVDFTAGMQAVLPLVLLAIVATIGGIELASRVLLPVLFVFFAIPIWDLAIVPLQWTTIGAVSAALHSTGFTAFIEGSLVHIPAGTFEIAEGCSGVRYFMVGLALATFYALLFVPTWPKRFVLIAVAGVAAVVSNWVRVYSLVVIGDLTEMQHYFVAESHDGFGWLVFVVFMLPVFALARYLESLTAPQTASRTRSRMKLGKPLGFFVAALAASVVVVTPASLRSSTVGEHQTQTLRLYPDLPQGWSAIDASTEWRPSFDPPDRSLRFALASPSGIRVDVFGAFYAVQRPEAKLLATRNAIHPGWQPLSDASRRVSLNGEARGVREVVVTNGSKTRVVWYWYSVGGVRADDRVTAKLLELWGLAKGRRDGAVVAVSALCASTCDNTLGVLTDYLGFAGQWTEAAAAKLDH